MLLKNVAKQQSIKLSTKLLIFYGYYKKNSAFMLLLVKWLKLKPQCYMVIRRKLEDSLNKCIYFGWKEGKQIAYLELIKELTKLFMEDNNQITKISTGIKVQVQSGKSSTFILGL